MPAPAAARMQLSPQHHTAHGQASQSLRPRCVVSWWPRRAWQRAQVVRPCRRQQQPQASSGGVEGPADPPQVPQVGWLWDRKAADTKQRLREQNIRPKKSLGQNFMLDDGVLERIVQVAGVQPGDLVLEIGPGTGNLTRHLLAAGAVVTAVEKDYALHEQLEREYAQVPELRVVQGDILRVNLPQLLGEMQQQAQQAQQQRGGEGGGGEGASPGPSQAEAQQSEGHEAAADSGSSSSNNSSGGNAANAAPRPIKVVANLPYNITKDCLLRMLPLGGTLSHLYFMLQDEVAVRLTGREPGGPDWRAMNLITQYYCDATYKFQIDRRKYHPVPQVHGAVVEFALRPEEQRPAVPSERGFLTLVKKAFSQRRKVVRNSLQPLYSSQQVSEALGALGLNLEARAQDLTLQDFVRLAWQLQGEGGSAAQSESPAEGEVQQP